MFSICILSAPAAVNNLRVTNTSSTSINVTWHKPSETNGVLIKYEIIVLKVVDENQECVWRVKLYCVDCTSPCPDAIHNQVNIIPLSRTILKREKDEH